MNLNNDKNLILAKKAIYAEQLLYYSKLCQSYQKLAEYLISTHQHSFAKIDPKVVKEKIANRYAEPLAKIVASNNTEKTLQELQNTYLKSDPFNIEYSDKEIFYFKDFAKSSNIFKTFQNAFTLIDNASKVEGPERKAEIDKFHKYMQNPSTEKTAKNFDDLISVHSPRYIGSRYFLISNTSIKYINSIDDSHIPIKLSILKENMNPAKFGAIINGCKTITGRIEELEKNKPHTNHFDIDNWDLSHAPNKKVKEARKEVRATKHSLKEGTYVAGSKASRFYTAHKSVLKKATAIGISVLAILGAVQQVSKEVEAANLDVNSSTQYEQTVTDETKKYINNIMKQLDLQSKSFDPQYQDVKDIEENIDLVLDYVVRDQVTTAFENYHTGYKVKDVETWFDKTNKIQNSDGTSSNYSYIDVTYVDDKGHEGKESIHDFRSELLTQNHLQKIFNLEEKIDLDSPIWEAFNDNGTKNFLSRANDINDVMEYLTNSINIVKHSASFTLEHGHTTLSKKPYLKSILPDKADNTNSNNNVNNKENSENTIDEER